MTIPNILTLIRILLMPVLVCVFSTNPSEQNYIATTIVVFACITDFLDGWFARRFDQKSVMGMIFDPIADKLMLTVVLILIIKRYPDFLITVLAIILLSREFIVAGIREALAILTNKVSLPVSIFGKLKTALQMIAIIILVAYDQSMPNMLYKIGYAMLSLATLMSIYSMYTYIKLSFSQINEKTT